MLKIRINNCKVKKLNKNQDVADMIIIKLIFVNSKFLHKLKIFESN